MLIDVLFDEQFVATRSDYLVHRFAYGLFGNQPELTTGAAQGRWSKVPMRSSRTSKDSSNSTDEWFSASRSARRSTTG